MPTTPRLSALTVCAALLTGCGPTPPRLEPVTGSVRVAGKPLAGGSVSLRPVGNALGHQPTGPIGADGRFEVFTLGRPGAPAGKYKVLVFADANAAKGKAAHPLPPLWLTHAKYMAEATTDLAFDVAPDPAPGRYDLSLSR